MSRTAAAMLTLTLAVGGCGSQDGPDPEPVAGSPSTPPSGATEVPEGFPVTEGMPPNDSGDDIAYGPDDLGLSMLDFCGALPLRGLDTTDRLTASSSGPEYSSTRDLMVFPDPERAATATAQLLDAARACPVEESGPGRAALTEVRPSAAGPGAATVVHTYATDGQVGLGAEIIEVVPVGTALLVTSSYGEWSPGPILDDGIARDIEALAPVLEAMRAFGDPAESLPTPADGEPVAPIGTGPIPDDLPLGLGLPTDDADHDVAPPSAGGDGVGPVEVCGTTVWPRTPSPAGRLAAGATGPEHADLRELVVLRRVEEAQEVVAGAREALARCLEQSTGEQSTGVWTVHEVDTGYDSVTFSLTYRQHLGASLFQLTRVGIGLLFTEESGEGTLAGIEPTLRARTALTREIAPAMCAFAADGC